MVSHQTIPHRDNMPQDREFVSRRCCPNRTEKIALTIQTTRILEVLKQPRDVMTMMLFLSMSGHNDSFQAPLLVPGFQVQC